MDPEKRQSLLKWLMEWSIQCADKSTGDRRLQKFISEYSEFVKHPDQHLLEDIMLGDQITAFEREGLLDAKTAHVLKRYLELINPPNPNAEKELYRIAYGPWWKRLFR